jgi:hypothetical protein
MSIIFVALSITTQINYKHLESRNLTPTSIEYHKEIGSIVLYDSLTNKNDTIILFKKVK